MAMPVTAAVRLLSGDKEPARLVSTTNLAESGLLTIDGVQTVAGDRVLRAGQTDATTNGIYIASEGTWRRAPDAATARLLRKGMKVHIQEGTHSGEVWNLDTDSPDVGTDDIEWSLYYSANPLTFFAPLRVVTAAGDVTVSNTETGVALNKTIGAATAITLPAAIDRNANGSVPITIKDLKRDAGTNNITISVSGGGTIDGFSTWTVAQDGAIVTFHPLDDDSGYYVGHRSV